MIDSEWGEVPRQAGGAHPSGRPPELGAARSHEGHKDARRSWFEATSAAGRGAGRDHRETRRIGRTPVPSCVFVLFVAEVKMVRRPDVTGEPEPRLGTPRALLRAPCSGRLLQLGELDLVAE